MYPDKKQMLKAFNRPDEKLLFSKALDQAFLCEQKHMLSFTEFLDPLKCEAFTKIIQNNMDIQIMAFGGAPGCERQLLGFAPEYITMAPENFPISALEISFEKKYAGALTHRDFLGSILGTGIDRSRVGDVFIFEERAISFVAADIADYVIGSLDKVGRAGVSVGLLAPDDYLYAPLEDFVEMELSVASMRLDAVASGVFRLSRGKAAQLIGAEKALVNWAAVRNSAHTIQEGDVVTLRGYGRFTVAQILGSTKKEKWRIVVHRTI